MDALPASTNGNFVPSIFQLRWKHTKKQNIWATSRSDKHWTGLLHKPNSQRDIRYRFILTRSPCKQSMQQGRQRKRAFRSNTWGKSIVTHTAANEDKAVAEEGLKRRRRKGTKQVASISLCKHKPLLNRLRSARGIFIEPAPLWLTRLWQKTIGDIFFPWEIRVLQEHTGGRSRQSCDAIKTL